ncbi:golgin IMH1-like [Neodiprion fabricii]|uniref:golgin IMH1-like n=1 Tax=Neodiprion fabricii TaxID=2872261 RepID=UPI001ED90BA4|nr:golgin IMH1-like [Neodiprion fabricii]XP_046413803.1 golgin IMH1-like [Neodiprion fabricii]
MTRFTRAKGSKASNERVPDEATPWSIMKMQLEDSQTASKAVTKKPKTATELLAEKDDRLYYDTFGNVNHEWAAFDNVPELQSKKNKIDKLHDIKGSKNNKNQKAVEVQGLNDNSSKDQVFTIPVKIKNKKQSNIQASSDEIENSSTTGQVKPKSAKKKKLNVTGNETEMAAKITDMSKSSDIKNKAINSTPGDTLLEAKSNSVAVEDLCSKYKQCKEWKKKSKKANPDSDIGQAAIDLLQQSQKAELLNSDCAVRDSITKAQEEGCSEKLSKRQKRNKKKQKKITSTNLENQNQATTVDTQKNHSAEGFDVQGNEWSNQVKFGTPAVHCSHRPTSTECGNQIDQCNNSVKKNKELSRKNGNFEIQANSSSEAHTENFFSDNSKRVNNNAQSLKAQKRKNGNNEKGEYKRRKPDEGVVNMMINGNEVQVVKYDGFPVKKEDADRLEQLKKNMIIKGIPRSDINIAMKLERRKAEKALARERKRVCFHCRKSGHNLSDCPELGRDEAGTGICFKCGSAEHTHFECRVVKGQEFRHASCFICREQGHIAKQCPDNPKGLYPQGGSCMICGDVTHLKKDCPDLIKEKEEANITADKIKNSQLESLQEDNINEKKADDQNKVRCKIVKF